MEIIGEESEVKEDGGHTVDAGTDVIAAQSAANMTVDRPWRVWRDGEWTILHIRAGGAETTISLTDGDARQLSAALSPHKPEPSPEWEAKAQTAQQRIRDELRATGDDYPPSLPDALRMLEKWIPSAEPANEQGQISFSRALMESAAEAMRAAIAKATGTGQREASPHTPSQAQR
jgi:hypothetical protein